MSSNGAAASTLEAVNGVAQRFRCTLQAVANAAACGEVAFVEGTNAVSLVLLLAHAEPSATCTYARERGIQARRSRYFVCSNAPIMSAMMFRRSVQSGEIAFVSGPFR